MSSELVTDGQNSSEFLPRSRSSQASRLAIRAIVAAGICVVILVAFTAAVETQSVSGSDRRFELLVHADLPGYLFGLMTALSFIGASGSIAVLAFVCVVLYLRSGDRWAGTIIAACPTGAGILDTALKDLFQRNRPHLWTHAAIVHSYSFPSGHATISSAFFAGLTYIAWRCYGPRSSMLTGLLCGVLVAGIGFSRVYLGVHWPSDVLAGYALGLAWVFALIAVVESVRGPAVTTSHDTRHNVSKGRIGSQVQ